MPDMRGTTRRALIRAGVLGAALPLLSAAPVPAAAAKPRPRKKAAASYRAEYHFTVPDQWKNDPQRPVWIDGEYHYYLYNADYLSRRHHHRDRLAPGDQHRPGLLPRPRHRRAEGHHAQRRRLVRQRGGRLGRHGGLRRRSGRRPRHAGAGRGRRHAGPVPLVLHGRRPHLPAARHGPGRPQSGGAGLPRPEGDPRRGTRPLGDGTRREHQGRHLSLGRPQDVDVRPAASSRRASASSSARTCSVSRPRTGRSSGSSG